MSILALPRDALHWEAAAGAAKLVQEQNSCPGVARLCCVFIAWLRVPRASDKGQSKELLGNVRVTSFLAVMHNFSSLWLLFSFLLHWLVSSLLSAMSPDSWMQLRCGWGAGRRRGGTVVCLGMGLARMGAMSSFAAW